MQFTVGLSCKNDTAAGDDVADDGHGGEELNVEPPAAKARMEKKRM